MSSIRIVIAAEALLAEGLRLLLRDEFTVLAVAWHAQDLLSLPINIPPDILLLDPALTAPDGVEFASEARMLWPRLRLVLLAQSAQHSELEHAVELGASGIVLKEQSPAELRDALRQVAGGPGYIAPRIQAEQAELKDHLQGKYAGDRRRLTPRQQTILRLFAEGHTYKQIASELQISVKTVEFHRAALQQRLGLHTLAELSRYAMEQHLVGPAVRAAARGPSGAAPSQEEPDS